MKLNKAVEIFVCFIIIFITHIFFVYFNNQYLSMYVWQRNISIITILFMLMSLLIIKKSYSLLSIPVLFIVLTYLFHFGQIIINGMFSGYKYGIAGNFIPKYTDYVVKEAVYYSFLTIQFVVLGIVIGKKPKRDSPCININKMTPDKKCKKIAKIVLCVSMPFKIGLTIAGILITYTYGYASTKGIKLSDIKGYGIMQTFANFYIIGIFLLLCYFRSNSRSFQKVYIIACIIGALSMLSGSRSKGVLDILCFTIFYFLISVRINKKRILKLLILCLITGVTAIVIADTRMKVGGVGVSTIFIHMFEMIKSNKIIGNALEEFGGTISSVLKVVEQENIYYKHQYGISYIKGIISIFPNLGYDNSGLIYTSYLNQNESMGGSYIGEFYFNFGKYSYILGFFLGIAVVKVYDNFVKYIKSKDYIHASYYVPVIYFLLFLPRDYLTVIFRPVVWGILLVYFAQSMRLQHDVERRSK